MKCDQMWYFFYWTLGAAVLQSNELIWAHKYDSCCPFYTIPNQLICSKIYNIYSKENNNNCNKYFDRLFLLNEKKKKNKKLWLYTWMALLFPFQWIFVSTEIGQLITTHFMYECIKRWTSTIGYETNLNVCVWTEHKTFGA